MHVQVELADPTYSRLTEDANRLGLDPGTVVRKLIESAYNPDFKRSQLDQIDGWKAYCDSRPKDGPILSDYAMSRESFYENGVLD